MKGRALRRAIATGDALRVGASVPLITDTTELITPTSAQELLKRNTKNRPINWKRVEEYAAVMARGEWELHAQGIVLDADGNILTGQQRLWAVVYSQVNVYMRVSRGNPPSTARLLDRGVPQSSRDLASRETGRKHSPTEVSIARGYCALMGNLRPSTDLLAETVAMSAETTAAILDETRGTKKSRSVLMVLGAIYFLAPSADVARTLARQTERFAGDLDGALGQHTANECWGRGAAFGLAMEHARRIIAAALAEVA